MVEWLNRRDRDRHGLGSKPTRAILLRPWGKTLYGTFPCMVVLASSFKLKSYISIKISSGQQYLGISGSRSEEVTIVLPYVLAPPSLSCESGE